MFRDMQSFYSGQIFNLDGTLTPSINFPKDIRFIKNFAMLQLGLLKMNKGAPAYLHYLNLMGKKLGVVSNTSERLIKKYNLRRFNSVKVTGDISSKDPSKKTNLILETLDDWEMKNNQAIYYGDTLKDAIACHDAKVRFCLVGNPKKKDLHEIQKISNLHIKSFDEAR